MSRRVRSRSPSRPPPAEAARVRPAFPGSSESVRPGLPETPPDLDPAASLAAEAQRRRRRSRRRRARGALAALRPAAPPVSPAQRQGAQAEDRALGLLEAAGLQLLARNVAGPMGELDLILQEGTVVVFVEVRLRSQPAARHVGALGSVDAAKQQRLWQTAALFLRRQFGREGRWPACRFDVVAEEAGELTWVRDAFQGRGE